MLLTENNKYLSVLILISLALLIPHLDMLPVNIMEARNLITAREMATDNHWLLTTLNGEPRYEKPPLPTWLTAFSGILFGFNSLFAMRLPVVLITLLLVLSIYFFSKKAGLTSAHSFRNGLILITSFYIFFAGRDNQWDMYCHTFTMLSIYFLWNVFQHKGNTLISALAGGLLLGFSILSKGPVSLYALLLPFLIAYGIVYKYRLSHNKKSILPIVLYCITALIIGLSWPVYIKLADAETLLKISTREATRWGSYNTKPFYYYWSFFTQSGIWSLPALAALTYPYMKNKVSNTKLYRFSFFWTICCVILLSIIPEKKSRYLLPVLIAMAINTGFYIEYLWYNFINLSKREKVFTYFTFGMIALVGVSFPAIFFIIDKCSHAFIWLCLASVSLFIIGITVIYGLYTKKFNVTFYSAIALQVVTILFAFPVAKCVMYHDNYQSAGILKDIAAKKNITIYEYNGFTPEIIWENGGKMELYDIKFNPVLSKPGGKIGLLATPSRESTIMETYKDYSIEKTIQIDQNLAPPGKKGHKPRLVRDLYIISNNR